MGEGREGGEKKERRGKRKGKKRKVEVRVGCGDHNSMVFRRFFFVFFFYI